MGQEASKPPPTLEVEVNSERELSQKSAKPKTPAPSLATPSAEYVKARREKASKPPNPIRQLSEKTGNLLLFTLQMAQSEVSGVRKDSPSAKEDKPSLLTQMSNSALKLSSKALGLPLDEVEPDAFKDEHESVPSAASSEHSALEEKSNALSRLKGAFMAVRLANMVKAAPPAPMSPTSPAPGSELSLLLEEHDSAIKAMASALASHEMYEPAEHDAIWLLRFLLSAKGNVSKATEDAKACMKWRAENNMEAVAAALRRPNPWEQWPGCPAGGHALSLIHEIMPMHVTHPDPNRGTIVFQRLADANLDRLQEFDDETFILFQLYLKEWLYQRRDATSRRTGTLAKNTIVLNMAGFSSAYLSNARFKKLLTHKAVKTADEMYPQSLGTMVIVGLPATVAFLFKTMVMPLAPKKVQEKIRVTGTPAKEFERLGVGLEHVPQPLGGTMAVWPPADDARRTAP